MESVGTILERNRGLGPGFDFLRVFLATMVVYSHAFLVFGDNPESMRSMWFIDYWVLAVFFSLSGFLITGSALRLTLSDFLKNRILRIVPALTVDIFISAMLLGPILTDLPLRSYFTSSSFFAYFLNVTGWPHYSLPGVFEAHPFAQVNVSLWTVPWEISCYVLMAILITTGLLSRTTFIALTAFALTITGVLIVGLENGFPISYKVSSLTHYFFAHRGSRLIICFLLGIIMFQKRYYIPYSSMLFFACVIYCTLIGFLVQPLTVLSTHPLLNLLAAVPLVYIMTFIGVSPVPALPLFKRGDYSYGIYLYGFPIQQLVFSFIGRAAPPIIQFLVAMPIIIAVAICSWHLVEKPIVRLRRRFSFVARLRLAEVPVADATSVAARALDKG